MSCSDGFERGGVGADAYADSVVTYLALSVSKVADIGNALVSWKPSMDQAIHLFVRQAIPMLWDFAETPPLSDSHAGGFTVVVKNLSKAISSGRQGSATTADAATRDYDNMVVTTDPPYYDNVGYADLSDFFYVWLRRSLGSVLPGLLSTMLTPKADELVADPFRHGGEQAAERFFEQGFTRVFERIRQRSPVDVPVTVFYAFKQSENDAEGVASTGWQTLLEGMLRAGWEVTATWPMRTELGNRMRNLDSNALASSVVLALRPRPGTAPTTTRRAFLTSLKDELPRALRELQQGSIAPVDLAQAAIGPGMAVFSRYRQVVEADGSPMTVRTALALINQALDEVLSEQEGDFDADTRFCVKWFSQFQWAEGDFGDADQLSRSTNTSVDSLVRGGVFWARAGRARLVSPRDMPSGWDPRTDERVSVWEVVVRLAKVLTEHGGDEAARLMSVAGQRVDLDTAKELAYLLYSICDKRGWADSALLFNGLGTSWSDLSSAARGGGTARATQPGFDFEAGDEE